MFFLVSNCQVSIFFIQKYPILCEVPRSGQQYRRIIIIIYFFLGQIWLNLLMEDCNLHYITKLKPSSPSPKKKKGNCVESWKTNNNSWNYNIDEDYTRLNHGEHLWPTYVHKYLSISIVIVKYCAKHWWTIEIYNKGNTFQLMVILCLDVFFQHHSCLKSLSILVCIMGTLSSLSLWIPR